MDTTITQTDMLTDNSDDDEITQCLTEISNNPTNSHAYFNLAIILPAKTITLHDGRTLTKKQLYLEAIKYNPSYSKAYNNLATCLSWNESIELPDGRTLTGIQLYLEAIKYDPSFLTAYKNLVERVSLITPTTLHDGRTFTRNQLYVEIIRMDPSDATTYYKLANDMAVGETITLHDGRILTRKQLLLEAIKINPSDPDLYYNIGIGLEARDEVLILPDGGTLTPKQAFLETIELDPLFACAYTQLAWVTGKDEIISVNGTTYTYKALLEKALKLDPEDDRPYDLLWETLEDHETFELPDGRIINILELENYLEQQQAQITSQL
jgi:tetratricopeptide (TPR) repeat protein